jgi:hypothetical protein
MVTVWVPLGAIAPVQLPLAVQAVAVNEDQVRVVDPPTGTRVLARDMTGTTTAVFA